MTFGRALEKIMRDRGMRAKDLADATGLGAPYISKLINGKVQEPTWSKACAIVDALGMTVDEFLEYQGGDE